MNSTTALGSLMPKRCDIPVAQEVVREVVVSFANIPLRAAQPPEAMAYNSHCVLGWVDMTEILVSLLKGAGEDVVQEASCGATFAGVPWLPNLSFILCSITSVPGLFRP